MLEASAKYWQELEVEIVVVGQGSEHPFASALQSVGYRVQKVPSLKALTGMRQWRRLLKVEKPDVIHLHTERAFAAAAIVAHFASSHSTTVRTIHSLFWARGRWGFKRRLQCLISDRYVDQFVCLTPDMVAHEETFGRNSVVIRNWVADKYFEAKSAAQTDVDVAVVGNCSMVKNHDVVLKAAQSQGWTVAHLGSEEAVTDQERALLEVLEVNNELAFRGVGDPLDWLGSTAVFAMPSVREGFGVSLAEAIAPQCACVVANAPGLEWARKFPLVFVAESPYESSEWEKLVRHAMDVRTDPGYHDKADEQRRMAKTDLSAERGVSEYVHLYRLAKT